MIITMVIKTTEEEAKQCIIAGWQKAYDEVLESQDLRDYPIGTEFAATDVENMLRGSCLGELVAEHEKVQMKVTG